LLGIKTRFACVVPTPSQPKDSRYIRKLAQKAAHGNRLAMKMLGTTYLGHHGAEVDYDQASCWKKRAALPKEMLKQINN